MSLIQEKPADAILVIDGLAKRYADARLNLEGYVTDFDLELAALRKKHLPAIKRAAVAAGGHKAALHAAIAASPSLFVKPRTMTLHGIKVGMHKGKGIVEWPDDEKLAARIQKLFPELYDVLVKTTHKPIAKALSALSVDDLRKLGCEVEETGDCVYIKAEDTAIDKLVARLLKEGSQDEDGGES